MTGKRKRFVEYFSTGRSFCDVETLQHYRDIPAGLGHLYDVSVVPRDTKVYILYLEFVCVNGEILI